MEQKGTLWFSIILDKIKQNIKLKSCEIGFMPLFDVEFL